MTERKGITPVIAIVLLLLITVGAVGVVYTQFQSIIGNPGAQVNQQQKVRNTGMTFGSLYKAQANGKFFVNMTVTNKKGVAWNSSDFRLSYVPEGTGSSVSGRALASTPFKYNSAADTCFSDDPNPVIVDPGESYTCNTGIRWPSPGQTIGFKIDMRTADKGWGPQYCSPQTSRAVGC